MRTTEWNAAARSAGAASAIKCLVEEVVYIGSVNEVGELILVSDILTHTHTRIYTYVYKNDWAQT